MKLSDFKMLTFDTYGTLIDWESGIYNALEPLLDKLPLRLNRDEVLELFAEYETQQQAGNPTQIYSSVLADVSRSIAKKWQIKISAEEAASFGRSVKHWPEFEDSAASLNYLRQHYLMATVTNCDRISSAVTSPTCVTSSSCLKMPGATSVFCRMKFCTLHNR
jgi:FMN phosphatase YigB (HAD superfamily)